MPSKPTKCQIVLPGCFTGRFKSVIKLGICNSQHSVLQCHTGFLLYFVSPRERLWRQRVVQNNTLVIAHGRSREECSPLFWNNDLLFTFVNFCRSIPQKHANCSHVLKYVTSRYGTDLARTFVNFCRSMRV